MVTLCLLICGCANFLTPDLSSDPGYIAVQNLASEGDTLDAEGDSLVTEHQAHKKRWEDWNQQAQEFGASLTSEQRAEIVKVHRKAVEEERFDFEVIEEVCQFLSPEQQTTFLRLWTDDKDLRAQDEDFIARASAYLEGV
jgi:hypothetical protein